MSEPGVLVTAAEISRLAGVTRATVSNWRRRHADFPAPTGGTESSPGYELEAVRAWLAARGQLPASSPAGDLATALRARAARGPSDDRLALQLLALVPALAVLDEPALKRMADLPDDGVAPEVWAVVAPHIEQLPGLEGHELTEPAGSVLRALLGSVRSVGARRTVDVLAEHASGDAASASGVYATPEPLADLMAALAADAGGSMPPSVFDPTCGTGGLLAAAARAGATTLSGQDILESQAAQAAVRLRMAAPGAHCTIRAGDSLRDDAFPDLVADAVLCNPPYGVRNWGADEVGVDRRWRYGLPPRGESELAWVQHCLAHLREGGTAVVLMPPGAAERPSGRRIRAEIVRRGVLHAVLALPPGMATPLHVGLHLWVLKASTGGARGADHVLFVDFARKLQDERRSKSSTGGQAGTTAERAADWPVLRKKILAAWRTFTVRPEMFDPVPNVACSRPIVDLLDDAMDLTPARHVRAAVPAPEPDRQDARAHILRSRLRRAGDALRVLNGGQEWRAAGAEPRAWRTATVADLLRGGAIVMERAAPSARTTQPPGTQTLPIEMPERPVLTAHDVASRRPASGLLSDARITDQVEIRVGDVILPELLNRRAVPARVAGARDAGALLGPSLYLLRPDPDRLDSWFLAGFLSDEENLHSATVGTSVVRVDVRRLRVPLLPLTEQRDYGVAFRRLRALNAAADLASRLADELAHQMAAGLTSGALLPPTSDTKTA